MKAGHQLEHFLLRKERPGESGEQHGLEGTKGQRSGAIPHLDSHSKIVSIFNPWNLQLQPGGDLGVGNEVKTKPLSASLPQSDGGSFAWSNPEL